MGQTVSNPKDRLTPGRSAGRANTVRIWLSRLRWPTVFVAVAVGMVWSVWGYLPASRSPPGRPLPTNRPTAPDVPAVTPVKPSADRSVLLASEARQVAAEMLRELPNTPAALLLAGRIHYAFNERAQADACWQRCLEVAPDFAEAWCSIGEAAWEHGEFERAAQHLRQAVRLNPDLDAKKVFFLADSLLNVGEPAEAAKLLEALERRLPLPAFGLFLLGHAFAEQEAYEEARKRFEAALAADPKAVNVHYALARVLDRLGQKQKAEFHRQEYARLKAQELEQIHQSRTSLRRIDWADVNPLVRECFLNAGKVYASRGRWSDAERHWRRALEVDPEYSETRILLAALYRQQGRYEDAERAQRGELPPPQPVPAPTIP